jgi:hypothetical protein
MTKTIISIEWIVLATQNAAHNELKRQLRIRVPKDRQILLLALNS